MARQGDHGIGEHIAAICFRRYLMQWMGEEGDPGRSIATHGSCRYHWGANQSEQLKSLLPIRAVTKRFAALAEDNNDGWRNAAPNLSNEILLGPRR
jgi:hypothetical protein